MIRRKMALLLAAPLLLAACASTPMSAENKASIRKVAIARQVDMPERPIVFGSGAGGAFLLGGMVGTAINQKASELPEQFVQVMATQRISVPDLVRQALAEQLKSKGFEVVGEEAQPDAVLKATIQNYGLTGNILSSEDKRFPLLAARFAMVRRNSDQVIWKQVVATNTLPEIMNQQEQRPLADYFQDGALLRREQEKVARLATGYAFRSF